MEGAAGRGYCEGASGVAGMAPRVSASASAVALGADLWRDTNPPKRVSVCQSAALLRWCDPQRRHPVYDNGYLRDGVELITAVYTRP